MHVMFRLVGGMHPPPKSATDDDYCRTNQQYVNDNTEKAKKTPLITYECIVLPRVLYFFYTEASIVLNLFLNFEWKWVSYSYKIALMKKVYLPTCIERL